MTDVLRILDPRIPRSRGYGMKLLFACSSGGHLDQLHVLEDWWSDHDRVWVTFDKTDSRSLLADERVVWAHHPTTRNIPNLLRNTALAFTTLRRERPDIVVSNGAGVALPFFIFAKLLRIRTMFIEVYDRLDSRTMTGRICYPLSDRFLLQWDEQLALYPNGEVVGRVL
jgi:UDP-N-acetylglucosamine:LPS N-acetylglucosamine transferase